MTRSLRDRIQEHLRVTDTTPDDVSIPALAGRFGAAPGDLAEILQELGASTQANQHEGEKTPKNTHVLVNKSTTESSGGADNCRNLWAGGDFTDPDAGVWPTPHTDHGQWMVRKADSKAPWAPWTDDNAPVECTHQDHEEHTTCDQCHHSAAFKWGSEGSSEYVHTDAESAAEWAQKHPEANGDLVFIQDEESDLGFVDGDDIRCPETGDVHPAFVAFLEHLGLTYADISTSGTGAHAPYLGEIPLDGHEQVAFEIDDDPWGVNEDPPTVEIYTNKHVCVMTGDHVPGTPTEARKWDENALRAILEAHDFEDEEEVTYDPERAHDDLDDYEPTVTDSSETTGNVRDIIAAVDDLRPYDLPLRTKKVGTDSTGWEKWDPSTYRTSSGGDSLHRPPGEPLFYDHKRGDAFGLLNLYAAERGINGYHDPTDRLAGDDFWAAVDAAREDGAEIPEFDPDSSQPTTAIPLALLDNLEDDEARRVARKHDLDWPDTREAQRRLRDRLITALKNSERTVVDAPTALGKSYTTATEPWRTRSTATGDQPVVQFHGTTEARDTAADHSAGANVEYRVLRGRHEACPVAAGDHDPRRQDGDNDRQVITIDGTPASQWFEAVCDGRGVPFSVAHSHLEGNNDQDSDLPCCADDTKCQSIAQWDGIPRNDDGETAVDVIHATHHFAMVPSLRNHVNMVFDERPDFGLDLSTRRVQQIVTAYLQHIDAPVTTWEEFVSTATTHSTDQHVAEHQDRVKDALHTEPEREWYLSDPNAHTVAPSLTTAVWYALREQADSNGRHSTTVPHEPPRLDAQANDDDGWNRVWLSVVLDDTHTVRTVRTAPDVSMAQAVVGLDAHPTPELWQANLGEKMTLDRVLSADERRRWRRLERGLTVVQVGDATRPFTSGEYFDEDGTGELISTLCDRFGQDFKTAVTAASVEDQHMQLLEESGANHVETMHFGEEKSRDDFAQERVGLVNGCIDPGDDYVLDLLAEIGLDAEPELVECGICGGSGCQSDPDCRDGQRRAHGREFVGEDADSASALLASVRENHVAQAAGRYARDARGDGGAVVFVRTDAMPAGFADLQVPGVEWVPTETQCDIIETLRGQAGSTSADVADDVGCSKEHVRKTLTELHDRGVVDVHEGSGEHGAHVYQALAGVDAGAGVSLEANDTTTTNDGV